MLFSTRLRRGDRRTKARRASEPCPDVSDIFCPVSAPPPAPVPDARHPAALAVAIFHAWRPYRWRGYAVGVLAGLIAGGVIAPLLTTTVVLAAAFAGVDAGLAGMPWAEILWTLTFVVVTPVVGALAVARWQPQDLQSAAQTYLWLAERSEARWRTTTGVATVPRDVAGMRAFLDATPPTPANAGERFGLWIALGEIAQARAAVEEMPRATPDDVFGHASASWLTDLVEGRPDAAKTVDELAPLTDTIESPTGHREALVTVALHRARVARAAEGDWRAPLAAVRHRLGQEPDAVYARFVWRPAFKRLLSACGTGVVVYWAALFALRWAYGVD